MCPLSLEPCFCQPPLPPPGLLQIPGLSSLSHTANSHWLSTFGNVSFHITLFLTSHISQLTSAPPAAAAAAKSLQSCPTLCDPIDGSPPGSSIPTLFQSSQFLTSCFFCFPSMIFSGENNGNPLQYCCLENPMHGGAW